MALSETWTSDFACYTVEKRQPKDDYTLRKSQHDRRKLRNWLNALMLKHDVLIWYEDNGEEKMVIATLLDSDIYPLCDLPITVEHYRKKSYLEVYHIRFLSMPTRQPMILHVDSIKRIIVSNKNVIEITNEVFKKF